MGYSIDGGFGEYATAYARYVVKVPDGIDPFDAAPLTCAGVTTYKAVKVAGTRSSDLVAVFGVGGLGHLAIQYAAIAGGRVIAVDLVDEKLELARELGAEFTVNAAKEDPIAAIQALGGADQAIALAVSPRAFEQAYGTLRRGGKLVFVALPADNHITLPIFETVLNGITVVGSIVGTRTDLREVFELHAAGKTRVIREVRPLARVNESIADVEAGRVAARIVFAPLGPGASSAPACGHPPLTPRAGGRATTPPRSARTAHPPSTTSCEPRPDRPSHGSTTAGTVDGSRSETTCMAPVMTPRGGPPPPSR